MTMNSGKKNNKSNTAINQPQHRSDNLGTGDGYLSNVGKLNSIFDTMKVRSFRNFLML